MRIGVTVPNVHETLAQRTTIEAVGRTADELGFDSIWCNDHLALPGAREGGATEPAYVGLGVRSWRRPLGLVAQELRIITGRPVEVPPAEEIYRSELTAAWAP